MRTPDIDKRNSNDIIRYIRNVASAYTPEWRFDMQNPDVGTALALIYADMFAGTIQRFNQVADKNMVAFFNSIDAGLLPATPAEGYVSFGLAGDSMEGVGVRTGTQVFAEVETGETGRVVFETTNDVYVTSADIDHIFSINGEEDCIIHTYDKKEAAGRAQFKLFDFSGDNLQEHVLYFWHDHVLNLKGGSWIEVEFTPVRRSIPAEILEQILNPQYAVWEYGGQNGYQTFEQSRVADGRLLFFKSQRQPAFAPLEYAGVTSYFIRCRVINAHVLEALQFSSLRIASSGSGIRPDLINSMGTDQGGYGCFPFGERFSVFNDVYLACDEALSKKGALVNMSFTMDFYRVPFEMEVADPVVNWKLIMKREQFIPDREWDITIEDVIWEYYNGQGWANLFPDKKYGDIFQANEGTLSQARTLTFICPENLAPILINSWEGYFIRARILRVNNALKTKGNYITPWVEGIQFSYEYQDNFVHPQGLTSINNLEEKRFTRPMLADPAAVIEPFKTVDSEHPALYLGFNQPPLGGPIKFLLSLQGTILKKMPRLLWEYYGRRGWQSLNIVDETENLRKTGIVTLMGNRDFEKARLYGQELFWIRLTDITGGYQGSREAVQIPVVRGIYINTTQVEQKETQPTEMFFIEPQQENLICQLINKKVSHVEVWVNEYGSITAEEIQALKRRGQADPVFNPNGELTEAWIKWQQVDDFVLSSAQDRHYRALENEGRVIFSDGRNGRIPPCLDTESIRVHYSVGGGEIGNLPVAAISRLGEAVGFINLVANPEITFGGCNQEKVTEALARYASAFRHRGRAVTVQDYEALAMEASRNILKARCFSNYNENGVREPGSVTLVILQKDFIKGRDFFTATRDRVFNYINRKISGNVAVLSRFYVIEPQFLELSVKVEVEVADFNRVFTTKEQILRRLENFINPMTGNFDGNGWEIGATPNRTQLINSLKDIPEISFIKNVFISAYTQTQWGRTEVDLDNMGDCLFALPLNGEHEVIITVK